MSDPLPYDKTATLPAVLLVVICAGLFGICAAYALLREESLPITTRNLPLRQDNWQEGR